MNSRNARLSLPATGQTRSTPKLAEPALNLAEITAKLEFGPKHLESEAVSADIGLPILGRKLAEIGQVRPTLDRVGRSST